MTNLDSVLKSTAITLLIKVCIVKAMVFPVVTNGCEIWTIKKAERQRTDAFKLFSSIQSLSHVCSHSEGCLFTLLIVSFIEGISFVGGQSEALGPWQRS